jgi:hypothetical protein
MTIICSELKSGDKIVFNFRDPSNQLGPCEVLEAHAVAGSHDKLVHLTLVTAAGEFKYRVTHSSVEFEVPA